MRLVGLMVVRNEDWILKASLDAALRWCDGICFTFHACTDKSWPIVQQAWQKDRMYVAEVCEDNEKWDEMRVRQTNLAAARAMGGTHFAIIDADEMLTHNHLPRVRSWFSSLAPGQALDVPMVPVWDSLSKFRNDGSVWCHSSLTLGFMDAPGLTWQPAGDGYQHHNRPPYGILERRWRPILHGEGGVMHLQFANKRRLLAKHVLYRMVDHLRWPERRSIKRLNEIYDEALATPQNMTPIPDEWYGDYPMHQVALDGVPWQEEEIRRLISVHGRDKFNGLDLKGF